MELRINKVDLLPLGNWLNSLDLVAFKSRARTRFVKIISDELDKVQEDRQILIDQYAEHDEAGELKVVENEGNKSYTIPEDKLNEFNTKVTELFSAETVIKADEYQLTLSVLKDIVLNYDGKIEGSVAPNYERWCEAFEAMGDSAKEETK